jgi:hypothetical protein
LQHAPEDTGLGVWTYTEYKHIQELPPLTIGQRVAMGEPIARVVTAIRSADARGVSSRRHGVQRPLEDVGGRHLVYHLTPALAGHVDVFDQESLDRGGG